MITRPRFAFAVILSLASSLNAATFVVPADRKLVRDASVIVIGSALASHAEKDPSGFIETVTTFSLHEVIKGAVPAGTLDIVAPGGVVDEEALLVPGSPRFEDGERYLLFLTRSERGWHVRDLVLGKFSFRTDVAGRKVVVRDESDIETPRSVTHQDRRRDAERFLDFVRVASTGGPADENYDIAPEPLLAPLSPSTETTNRGLLPIATATFSATSFTAVISGSLGARWNVFPAPVAFTSVGTIAGAPGGGSTAITTSFASWNNEPNSNINYVYAGADPGTHNSGLSSPDGGNTISWERDLTRFGAPRFQCNSSSYSGTLGLGGITSASASHAGPNGETFVTTNEGDVEMNQGLANCTLLLNSGDFNSGVAHEVGHTLGFRHSDRGRASGSACTADLECSSSAIMTTQVTAGLNAALQPWDQHAAAAVYPGASPPPALPSRILDVDGNGRMEPLTDGLLILRYLFGFRSATLTNGAIGTGATRLTPPAIESHLTASLPLLDVDGNGSTEPLADGLLILRYLFGFRGTTLTGGAVGNGATRSSPAAIEAYIAALP